MKEYVLSYYPNFKCIAGDCKHTCCAGWEMNIDRETLSEYKAKRQDYTALESGIDFKKSKFKADKSGRCAFLNDKNLCEIIINLGEQSLCQVCRDHPRFRSFFDDRIELGLGFCCETATKMILSFDGKIEPVLVCDDNKENPLNFNHKNILEFREKALAILQDRSVGIDDRINQVLTLCKADFKEKDFSKLIKLFLSFERLDKGWAKRIKMLKKTPFSTLTDKEICAEQFLVNGIYRHLYNAEDTVSVRAITLSLVLSLFVIINIAKNEQKTKENLVDIVRAFSAEVEYSQNNLDKLFNFAYKFIKIG